MIFLKKQIQRNKKKNFVKKEEYSYFIISTYRVYPKRQGTATGLEFTIIVSVQTPFFSFPGQLLYSKLC